MISADTIPRDEKNSAAVLMAANGGVQRRPQAARWND
jgi:hypothetical protein